MLHFSSILGKPVSPAAAQVVHHTGRRAVLLLTLSVWLGSFALSTIKDLAAVPPHFTIITEMRFGFAFLGAAFCFPILLLLNAAARLGFGARALFSLPLTTVAAIVYTQLAFFSQHLLLPPSHQSGSSWTFYNTVYWLMFFLLWTSLYLALSYSQAVTAHNEASRRLEAFAHDAQVRALRYQVDPHFLFNSLNSVSALVIAMRNAEAERMIANLSRFYRASVEFEPTTDIALDEEIQLQRTFLELEQVRFPDMVVEIAVTSAAGGVPVPALLLQPILENAITHAVARRMQATRITIDAAIVGGELRIVVENAISPTAGEAHGTGTGIRNTRARMKTRFGDAASLVAGIDANGMFVVDICIPIGGRK